MAEHRRWFEQRSRAVRSRHRHIDRASRDLQIIVRHSQNSTLKNSTLKTKIKQIFDYSFTRVFGVVLTWWRRYQDSTNAPGQQFVSSVFFARHWNWAIIFKNGSSANSINLYCFHYSLVCFDVSVWDTSAKRLTWRAIIGLDVCPDVAAERCRTVFEFDSELRWVGIWRVGQGFWLDLINKYLKKR